MVVCPQKILCKTNNLKIPFDVIDLPENNLNIGMNIYVSLDA